jgi:hypothetical protein
MFFFARNSGRLNTAVTIPDANIVSPISQADLAAGNLKVHKLAAVEMDKCG